MLWFVSCFLQKFLIVFVFIILRFDIQVVSSIPTIGFNVEQITYGSLHMSVWDIGGQDRIRKLWKFYFSGTDLLIFVVDSNDDSRLEEARAELHQLMKEDELRNAVLLVYANKMDLPHALSVSEIADRLKLRDLKQRHLVQATSASTGNGLYEGLEWAANELKTQKKSGVY
jgi:small GTP-binding protein